MPEGRGERKEGRLHDVRCQDFMLFAFVMFDSLCLCVMVGMNNTCVLE